MELSKKINELIERYENGKLSHAFLIQTNNIDKCILEVKEFIKVINCPKKFNENCNESCNICKLIDLNNLPNLILIEPDGMSIKKFQLQELQEKFSTKPVYSKYNSYIIKNAEVMNSSSANCILKFLEEPEDYIIGFYITKNKEKILDTIKSRCQILSIVYDEEENTNSMIQSIAEEYLDRIKNKNDLIVNRELILKNLNDRTQINELFTYLLDYFMNKIRENYFPGNNFDKKNGEIIIKKIEIVQEILKMNQYNVNIELLLDKFVIEMRDLNE